MSVAVNTLTSRFGTIANDTGLVNWTSTELVDWLNEGQVALVKIQPDAKTKTAAISLVAGAKQTNPADCISIIEIRQNTGGNVVTKCDRKALDLFSPGWMNATQSGTIQHFMDDPQTETFYVYPPAVASTSVQATYGAIPATVSAGGNIDVRDIYADRLLNYMLFRAYSKDGDGGDQARAAAAYQLFTGS